MDLDSFLDSIPRLPSPPALLGEVLGAADASSFGRLASLVERDQALSAATLRVANSAFYGASGKTPSVRLALSRIGILQLREIVASASMMDAFRGLAPGIDFRGYWRHNVATAVCCGLLESPRLMDREDPTPGENPYYVAGLLHRVGQLALAMRDPHSLGEARDRARVEGLGLAEAERRIFGFDHAQVGGALLDRWRLPTLLGDAARYHLEPDKATRNLETVRVVHISTLLCRELGSAGGFEGPAPALSEDAYRSLGWTGEQLGRLKMRLGERVEKANLFADAILDA